MRIFRIVAMFCMAGFCLTANAGEKEKADAIQIVNSIVGVCKEKGMLACEPNIQGADFIFKYIRLFEYVSQLDKQYVNMLKKRYPEDQAFDFDVIQASLNLSLDITFTPEKFSSRVTSATQNENGYDVVLDDDSILQLHQVDSNWVAIFPPEVGAQFKQLEPYYTAGQLKRSILIYRMLEAEMADLDKDQVEANVSSDLAPVMMALFGQEKFPALMKWGVKDVSDVVQFYTQFSTIDDMKVHVTKVHHLSK